ncbi:MAG: hypothetical protein EBR49_12825 [Betaproteobacteria bacterium]|nr:hypothetical protein [Betaproteobacteria bacterium]
MTETSTTLIATHSGTFHADDVFGVGILMGVFPSHRLIRTRTLKPMPDIDVTGAADPWGLFEEAYKTANTP